MTRPRIAAVALAALLAFGVTGCSPASPDKDGADGPAAPATGTQITGTGYSYAAPAGWEDPGEIPGYDLDTVVVDPKDADGFSDNLNVLLSPAGLVAPELIETAGVTELEGSGAQNVTVQPRAKVDGTEAPHLSATLSENGTDYLIEQYYVSSTTQTYVVTFSFSDTVSAADRAAVIDPVLASWEFAD